MFITENLTLFVENEVTDVQAVLSGVVCPNRLQARKQLKLSRDTRAWKLQCPRSSKSLTILGLSPPSIVRAFSQSAVSARPLCRAPSLECSLFRIFFQPVHLQPKVSMTCSKSCSTSRAARCCLCRAIVRCSHLHEPEPTCLPDRGAHATLPDRAYTKVCARCSPER